jgi:predicted Zn-dependent peptidase
VAEAVEVIMAEYQKVAAGKMGITKEELTKAKEYLKGHLVLALEDSRSVSNFYGHQELLEHEVLNPDQILQKIDAVTKEQIDEMGKKYFVNKGLNLALIGNFENKEALEKLLSF